MSSSADRLFARWCRRGDAGALATLFDRTAPRLLRLGVHLVGDAGGAEDLVQATFVALIEQGAAIDSARPAWPWLATVLARKAADAHRLAWLSGTIANGRTWNASGRDSVHGSMHAACSAAERRIRPARSFAST